MLEALGQLCRGSAADSVVQVFSLEEPESLRQIIEARIDRLSSEE